MRITKNVLLARQKTFLREATTLRVCKGWNGFGLSDAFWTAIILLVGTMIGILTILSQQDIAYGLVLIWAYAGIWLKHTSTTGFAGRYPMIIYVTLGCIAVFL